MTPWEDALETYRKRVKALLKHTKEADRCIGDLYKAKDRWQESPYVVDQIAQTLKSTASAVSGAEPVWPSLLTVARQIQDSLTQAKDTYKAKLGADIARRLEASGIAISGHFPNLKAGFLMIACHLADGSATIWYGPFIEKLSKEPLDSEKIEAALVKHIGAIAQEDFDRAHFLHILHRAYENVRKKQDIGPGTAVPIIDMLVEVSLLKQSMAFRSDPEREHFIGYGRVRFSYDLYRAGFSEVNGKRLKLGIATREQTKTRHTHLWVPSNSKGDGTRFGTVQFV